MNEEGRGKKEEGRRKKEECPLTSRVGKKREEGRGSYYYLAG
ncbi:hypothetical protein [Microcoleus sp. S13C4]